MDVPNIDSIDTDVYCYQIDTINRINTKVL